MPEGGGKANTSFSSSGPQRKSYPVQLVVWFIGTKQFSADNQIDGFEPVRGENNLEIIPPGLTGLTMIGLHG